MKTERGFIRECSSISLPLQKRLFLEYVSETTLLESGRLEKAKSKTWGLLALVLFLMTVSFGLMSSMYSFYCLGALYVGSKIRTVVWIRRYLKRRQALQSKRLTW